MKPSQKQLTSIEANQTRLVTKCRWVVEAINGIFKQSFKALDEVRNTQLPHIFNDFKIAAALINFSQINLRSDDDDVSIANEMLSKINEKNRLEHLLKTRNDSNQFTVIDAVDLNDFPRLDVETLKNKITLGSYQLKQSFSYLSEHLNTNNGKYLIKLRHEEEINTDYKLISALIQSRHSNKTKYKLFIKYLPNKNDYKAIDSWVCSCKVGLRTVGCCSHIASVIYYMSYAKYSTNPIPNPGKRLNSFLIIPTRESSSEEEEVDTNDNGTLNKNQDQFNREDAEIIHDSTYLSDNPCTSEQSMKRSCTLTLTEYENNNTKSTRILRSYKK